MRCLSEEFKSFFILLETCFVYGIQGGNNLSDKGPCVVGCNYNAAMVTRLPARR